jgi:putative ABC transport system permease protein
VISLVLGLFLIVNTVNAIVAQQIPQIGVIKAVGGSTRQVLGLYISVVLIYGLLALLFAIPLGILAANGVATTLLSLFTIPPAPGLQVSIPTIIQQLVIGLLVPLLAALWPIYNGVRVTVREAISSYGLDMSFGKGLLDRLLSQLRFLPRTVSLTLRNTFRRKGRVVLTQITLVMAGVVYMMVMTSGASFTYTINQLTDSLGLNVLINFQRPVRIDEINSIVQAQPNIDQAEMQLVQSSTAFVSKDAEQGEDIFVEAVRPESTILSLPVLTGRWLLPDDGHAVVMNRDRADKLNLKVGDTVWFSLESNAPKTEWTIVGTVFDLSSVQHGVYVPIEVYQRDVGLVGRSTSVWVTTTPNDVVTQRKVEQALRDAFDVHGIPIANTQTADSIRTTNENNFRIITTMLNVMSALIAVVGAIGLAGTLSINVLERQREIGVMRAIGASSITIAGIFIGEGLLLGILSWLIALPISIPVGRAFAQVIGGVINFAIIYQFSWNGVVSWLMIVMILSVIGSVLPALRAAHVSVRESLAYE